MSSHMPTVGIADIAGLRFESTQQLRDALTNMHSLVSIEEDERRGTIARIVQIIVEDWMTSEHRENLSGCHVTHSGRIGQVIPFGSFRLKTHTIGSDIDMVCVAPFCFTRSQFFTKLFYVLQQADDTSNVYTISNARTPVIKLTVEGVNIDLVFVRSLEENIRSIEDTPGPFILRNIGEECKRSVSGHYTTETIASAVGDNEEFRLASHAIKTWATNNGIYSNTMGYPGGIAWTLLVARIFLENRSMNASEIVRQFFETYSQFDWNNTVHMTDVNVPETSWSSPDYGRLMNVSTPCEPYQNTTRNVGPEAVRVIKLELVKGRNVVRNILVGRREWTDLFTSSFFEDHPNFICLLAHSPIAAAHKRLACIVESKLRVFVTRVSQQMETYHLNTRRFEQSSSQTEFLHSETTAWIVGYKPRHNHKRVEFREELDQLRHDVTKELHQNNSILEIHRISGDNIYQFVPGERSLRSDHGRLPVLQFATDTRSPVVESETMLEAAAIRIEDEEHITISTDLPGRVNESEEDPNEERVNDKLTEPVETPLRSDHGHLELDVNGTTQSLCSFTFESDDDDDEYFANKTMPFSMRF